jgi:hypothetical protein
MPASSGLCKRGLRGRVYGRCCSLFAVRRVIEALDGGWMELAHGRRCWTGVNIHCVTGPACVVRGLLLWNWPSCFSRDEAETRPYQGDISFLAPLARGFVLGAPSDDKFEHAVTDSRDAVTRARNPCKSAPRPVG